MAQIIGRNFLYSDYVNGEISDFTINDTLIFDVAEIQASQLSIINTGYWWSNVSSVAIHLTGSYNKIITLTGISREQLLESNFSFADGSKIILGTQNDDNLTGTLYGDYIEGKSGNDVIDGGAGNDTLIGGEGNDVIYGGEGNDTLNGGDGEDILYGGSGDDTFQIETGHVTALGDEGNDIFQVSSNLLEVDLTGGQGQDIYDLTHFSEYWNSLYSGVGEHNPDPDIYTYFMYYEATENSLLINDFNTAEDKIDLNFYKNQHLATYYIHQYDYDEYGNEFLASTYQQDAYGNIVWRGNANSTFLAEIGQSVALAGNNTSYVDYKGARHDLWRIYDINTNTTTLYADWDGSGIVEQHDFFVKFSGDIQLNHLSFINPENFILDVKTHYSQVTYTLKESEYNLTLITDANINATGNSHANTLIGNKGNNIINGGGGADIMQGGLGNDIYYVDHVNDKVIEKNFEGTDKIYSSVNYSLSGTYVEVLELTGETHLSATGNSHANTLIGNKGNNILNGGGGADVMQGGLGNDIYYVDHINDKVIEKNFEGTDKIYSSVNYSLSGTYVEVLELTGEAHLSTTGNSHANTLIGNKGNNILNGGGGADIMQGGLGNDVYYVDHINDKVIEKNFEGTDKIYSSVNYSLSGTYVEVLELTGEAHLSATGNSHANTLIGNKGNNILNGGGGADIMQGGLGNDIYYVDHINDKVIEKNFEGTDKIYSSVNYSLSGTYVEVLELTGEAHLSATGNSHANTLIGNKGNNILNGGGGGADIMQGGLGNDIYYVDHINDKVIEKNNEGIDTIYSSVSYGLSGTYVEILELTGNSNINATGNSHANTLIGNKGNNILDGGGGNDILTGGLGADTALYQVLNTTHATGGNGMDIWTDFTVAKVGVNAQADKIDISALLIGFNGVNTATNLENYLTVTKSGADTIIYIDRDGLNSNYQDSILLTLKNVDTTLNVLVQNNQFII